MNLELKKAIVNYIFDNSNEFQIINSVKNKFRLYIYDDKGEYLIGGKHIAEFIEDTIELLINR
jgi:hypothetical protein